MVARRVIIIGLDSAPPELLFGELLHRLPNLSSMVKDGLHGPLRSCHPPITVPAWQVMATSASPGRLGLYGFRHRKGFSYTDGWTPNSRSVLVPQLWDVIGSEGKRSCLVGVPPGYPPRPVNGWSISCFLTPPDADHYTHPDDLRTEVESLVGNYVFDVKFRVEDRDALLEGLFDMTKKRFDVVRHLATTKPWDLFMLVEIGVDRLHHAFWKFFDHAHHKYSPGNPYENVAEEYYRLIDERLGDLMEAAPDAIFMVVSDHGSKGMKGAFCVNQWLVEKGYLVLSEQPQEVVPLEKASVDWGRTRAWGWGGYYARIFLNMRDREPDGFIPSSRYEEMRGELAEELGTIRDPTGAPMRVQVFRPEDLYTPCLGDKPDLMVYFDDLSWRSAGTLGHGSMYLSENDTGPDDAVHAMDGVFILYDPRQRYGDEVTGLSLLDVAPTVLQLMDVTIPDDMEGKLIDRVVG